MGTAAPVLELRITEPAILYIGRVEVAAVISGVDIPEAFRLLLSSRRTPVELLSGSRAENDGDPSLLCDVNALDKVRGTKNPSFPKGILSPCTTYWELVNVPIVQHTAYDTTHG